MTWFRKSRPTPDPAIHHDETRRLIDHLQQRLDLAEATIESQATELATLRADGKRTNGALCQLANDAAPAVKTHERLEELRHDLRVLQSAVYELTGTVVRSKTICERFELTETAVNQLAANQKALGDRLTVQAGVIGSTELASAEARDGIQRLESTVSRLRSERDSRLKDAIRVLSGEATILVAHPVSEFVKIIDRDTGSIRETKIP
jgi:chromosome segregation ATPase